MKTISFYVMTYKGFKVLDSFISKYGHGNIGAVISAKDPGVQNDYYSEIETLATKFNIPFYNRSDDCKVQADFSFTISWKWIIKDMKNLIVFHDSCLPKYRGFAPLANALINGDKEVGVTALFANAEYDRGEIILQKKMKVKYPLKINDAIEQITDCYVQLVNELGGKIIGSEAITGVPQTEKDATYSLWRDEEDYFIDWTKDAGYIKRFIDSVGFPYKGAAARVNDNRVVRILDAEVIADVKIENRTPGKVIFINDGLPVVVCGKGLLMVNALVEDINKESQLPLKKLRTRFY